MSKSINVNYKSIIVSAVSENKTAEQVRMSFRPGGKDNMVKAMNGIIEELKSVDDARAKAIVALAKQVIEPKAAPAPAVEVPWWQTGSASALSDIKVEKAAAEKKTIKASPKAIASLDEVDEDDDLEKTVEKAVVIPVVVKDRWMDDSGIYRVTKITDERGDNVCLQALSQGRWETVMSSRQFEYVKTQDKILRKAMEKFADLKEKVFSCKVQEKIRVFVFVNDKSNPSIKYAKTTKDKNGKEKTVAGRHYISLAQLEKFYKPNMDMFLSVPECKAAL